MAEVNFELYNEETVRILKEEDPDLLPDYSVNSSKDLAYNKKQVTSAITSGIIKGESIPKIASNLQSTINNLNQSSAVSAARTAAIAAQNTGSLSSMKRLAEMGVEVQKEWVATLDVRTRPSHRALDGQRRNLDEAFSNGLQYPGASGNPAERWNCRCKIKAYMPKYDSEDEPRLTYSEWLKTKDDSAEQFSELIKGKLKFDELYDKWQQLVPNDITTSEWQELYGTYIATPESFIINKALRKNPSLSIRDALNKEGLQGDIAGMELMEYLIETHTLENNTLLIRNVKSLDGTGLSEAQIHAVIYSGNDSIKTTVCSMLEGIEIQENSVVSTSGNESANYFKGREIQLKIKAPKGTHALITENAEECEVILPRGTKYVVEKAEITNDKLIMTVVIKSP